MSQDKQNTSPELEKVQEETSAVDPRDLVRKPTYITERDPQEMVNEPVNTPQMLNEDKNERGDLRRD